MPFIRRPADFSGFVRREGAAIVDGAGRPLLLRGMGIGNWLLPEGYMWKTSPKDSPRQIEALFVDLVGGDAAGSFWQGFRANFFNEDDVRRIAESGFDHIRLPISARIVQDEDGSPIEAGHALIDRCVEWCRTHNLWLLLDLHGAPGGQTGTNIDDAPRGEPDLFIDPARYRDRTIALWQELARRYRHETVVMGYDLLNEPLPNEWQHKYPNELVALYKDLTLAVRAIDPDHLIMYEGAHWATNWSIFTEAWDENSVLQFHRYWMPPDRAHIAEYLDARERLGLPIYMGEGGENNLHWLYAAHRLYETHDIGWNFWPWKKIDTRTSPASIAPPEGWSDIVGFAQGGPRPSPAGAQATLDALLEAMKIGNCTWNEDVLRAIIADAPAEVPAWAYGYRGAGVSFAVAGGAAHPDVRPDEAAGIVPLEAEGFALSFHHTNGRPYALNEQLGVRLSAGDWLEFEFDRLPEGAAPALLDREGGVIAASFARTPRGLRATAKESGLAARLVLRAR
ncbi:MAG: cellulase family glycosylhydrolase [Devosia sp.]|nr:cellulase family glycosylhydrolase [Devosia sp.]